MIHILVLFKSASQGKHEMLSNLLLDDWDDLGSAGDAEHQLLSTHLCVVMYPALCGNL